MIPTPGQVVEQYLKLREQKKLLEAKLKAEIAPYDAALDALETYALQLMQRDGTTNLKTDAGVAFQKTQTFVKLEDREKLVEFARQADGGMDIFTNAISKDFVLSWIEKHGAPPPGAAITREIVVQFRKA